MPVYLITYLIVFWLPVFILAAIFWKRFGPLTRRAFWISMAVMAAATFVMEYVYVWLDVWSFSEAVDPLLGVNIGGIPIEEFVFWFGAAPLFVFIYVAFDQGLCKKFQKSSIHA